MGAPRIMVVEDEEALARGLAFNLEQEGYVPAVFGDGPAALAYFQEHPGEVDLILLDLMLPGMSGYEICREIRTVDGRVPILVLSARTLSEDRSQAFDCGTDQYLTKPFALPELLSRVRNLLDRSARMGLALKRMEAGDLFRFGNVTVDFARFEVRNGETVHTLTTMEMQLLRYLIQHEGTVLSRSRLLKDVWAEKADLATRSIDNFVMRLRKVIEQDPANPTYLVSIRGTGYRFDANPGLSQVQE
ncbi:Sensory transduction protein regX3 [Caulifigura coniformis]|uniref:Sensory transduction protein regX3 n=1 Tax=Caulifigura coniformis TaxID=2527983 RepID=A0A517SC73_9PLAN|nr:response regulator transcription factor [Caulifigura coniformis]QDT53713.1 Sensory transduction protein regX3 [Caulifigura coniformis]